MSSEITASPEQFEALLREAAKGVTPAEHKAPTLAKQLAPHKKTLLKLRGEGYSVSQIAGFMKGSKLGVTVSTSFLRQFLAPHRPAQKKTAAATSAGEVKYTALTRPTAAGATAPVTSGASKAATPAPGPAKTS